MITSEPKWKTKRPAKSTKTFYMDFEANAQFQKHARVRDCRSSGSPMKTSISVIVGALVVVAFANCGKKTMSGEYRSEVRASTATIGNAYVLQVLDFRSDGTYSINVNAQRSNRNLATTSTKKGTYKIKGNKVFLTQTSDVLRSFLHDGSERPSKTSTEKSQWTLSIEPNGDLVNGNTRFKKQ